MFSICCISTRISKAKIHWRVFATRRSAVKRRLGNPNSFRDIGIGLGCWGNLDVTNHLDTLITGGELWLSPCLTACLKYTLEYCFINTEYEICSCLLTKINLLYPYKWTNRSCSCTLMSTSTTDWSQEHNRLAMVQVTG